jgi:hypothetical protein
VKFRRHTSTVQHSKPVPRQEAKVDLLERLRSHIEGTIQSLAMDEETVAFGFFVNRYVMAGRMTNPVGGFFDNIVPALTAACADSTVYLAFSALAPQMYSQW